MIFIKQFGFSCIVLLCTTSCGEPMISRLRALDVKNAHQEFANYCERLDGRQFETIAVESSFYGDYRRAIAFATKDYDSPSPLIVNTGNRMELSKKMEQILEDGSAPADERIRAQRIIDLLNRGRNLDGLFQEMEVENAKAFIVAAAKEFHFLLMNEAHYSTQNRIFTESLLKPLWEVGYRYLALETLNVRDSALTERGYPTTETGFYTRDPSFSNMVREALELGYKLVPYETIRPVDGTSRDSDQARNIFNSSYRNDRSGKVLVHAGYSHISEKGREAYPPMGEQSKDIYGKDILTVDQQTMTELSESLKENVYYRFAEERYHFKEPVLFRLEDALFVDPIQRGRWYPNFSPQNYIYQ